MDKSKHKILLLDSDRWFADSLESDLSDFSVIRLSDPDKAFDAIEKQQPDLILADVMLGARNLFALLHEMQSYLDTRDLPVVILSSLAGKIKLDDVKQMGVRAVIDKSDFTADSLAKTIKDILLTERANLS